MYGKLKATTLGFVAGFALLGFSNYANAQSCSQGARTFNDYMQNANPDGKRISPYDCATVRVSTPVLAWAHDRNVARPYAITVVREGGGFSQTYTRNDPRLLIPDVLPAGTYEWKVTYYRTSGTETSQGRRFIIPSGTLFAIPSGATVAGRVAAKGHPRTQVGNTNLYQVAQLARNEFGQSYAAFMAKADEIAAIPNDKIAGVPANETLASYIQRYGDVEGRKQYSAWLISLRDIAMAQGREIKILGYAFQFTGSAYYQNKGLERLQRLADWPSGPEDATSHKVQDQANREIFLALAIGMDLFHDALSTQMYAPWQKKILARYIDRFNQVDFSSFNTFPRDSHLLTVARYAMEASMYAAGAAGYTDSASKLAKQWELWITTLGSWGENLDGGFGNSDYYGWMNALGVIQGATTVRLVANVDLTKWDLIGKTGNYLINISPPKVMMRQNFGDGAEAINLYQQYGKDVRLLSMLSGNPAYDWYWRVDSGNILYKHQDLGVEHYLVLALHNGSPVFSSGAPSLPGLTNFSEAGIVAMHSSTSDPMRTSVFFRSSAFGSFSHSHADQNSFTMSSKGQPLLINAGYYDYSGSPHHLFVTRTTRYKNALTFDNGIGQAERTNDGNPVYPGIPLDSTATYGRIHRTFDNPTWAVAVGDASMAYRGFDPRVATSTWKKYLTGAYRTVAYNRKEGVVVVYDYATSATPRQWELNYHSINLPTWQNGQTMVLSNNGVTACLDVYGNNGTTRTVNYRRFRHSQTDQWPVLPMRYSDPSLNPSKANWSSLVGKIVGVEGKPNQAHTIFYDPNKSAQVTAVTVIRENCRNVSITADISGSWASVKINNASSVTMNGLR